MPLPLPILLALSLISLTSSASVAQDRDALRRFWNARNPRLIPSATLHTPWRPPSHLLIRQQDPDPDDQSAAVQPPSDSNPVPGVTDPDLTTGDTADTPTDDTQGAQGDATAVDGADTTAADTAPAADDPLLPAPGDDDAAGMTDTGTVDGAEGVDGMGVDGGDVGDVGADDEGEAVPPVGDTGLVESGDGDGVIDERGGPEGKDAGGDAVVTGQTAGDGDDAVVGTGDGEEDKGEEEGEEEGGEDAEDGAVDAGSGGEGGEEVTTGDAPGAAATSDEQVPETPTAGNETAAFLSFQLNQMVEIDDGSAAFDMRPVFQNGSLVGRFADSPKMANFDAIDEEEDDRRWYNDGPYADRITFQYIFTPESKDYGELRPKIWTEEPDSGIAPILENESLDRETGVGQFTLLYRCEPGGAERNRIALHISVTGSRSVDTMWVKVCGHGRFEHMHFGFIGGDEKLMEFNVDGTYGDEEKHLLEVGPTQLSTVLSVGLEQPAWELQFKTPYLTSDSELVSVSLRETVTGGTLSADDVHKFSILYSCAQNSARANIDFTFAIPPWDNVTASWRKNCGGVHSQGLLIGTSGSGSYEVMQDGELNEKYNVTEDTSLEKAYGVIKEIDGKTNAARFYVKNSDDAADISIQTIALTMSNPDVLRGVIEVPFGGSGSYLSASGGIVGRLETKSLRVRFICRKVGESLVMVTLPIQKFKNVEFGFIKHCLEPQVYHESGFLQTAGSLLGAIFVLSICGGIGFWVYMRRRSQSAQKWTAVPTSDENP